MGILARALGLVQGQVRVPHQRVRILAMEGIDPDTGAGGDTDRPAPDVIGLRHDLDHF